MAKAGNLTAICELIVERMWEPRRPTTLWTFKACYKDSFTFFLSFICFSIILYSRQVFLQGLFSSCFPTKISQEYTFLVFPYCVLGVLLTVPYLIC
jgi:hypothetical protein